jgi:subtilisin family serine protease
MSSRKGLIVWTALLLFVVTAFCGAAQIHLRYGKFDPQIGEPWIPTDLRMSPEVLQKDYYILQFSAPIEPSWKDEVTDLGVELLDYVPDFAFIARITPELVGQIEKLPMVRAIVPFHPAYRISPDLFHKQEESLVTIQLFPGESSSHIRQEIERLGGRIQGTSLGPAGEHVEAVLSSQTIRKIARLRGVAWIEPRLERRLKNDIARVITGVTNVWTNVGLYGSGEIIAVCDTGLDTGNLSTISADFAGRVLKTYALGRPNKWNDPNGHGTHVAGSVLGSGVLSGADPPTHSYADSFAGVAPEALLIFQSVLDNSGGLRGIPSDLNNLFLPPYNDGARIHTNSWGAAYNGAYPTDSRNLDLFTWNHKDMVILMAAGNEGIDANADGVVDLDSMDAPATAKNCIAVGATESYRLSGGAQGTYGDYWPSDFPANPIRSDKVSNNSQGMVAFSSRGPCDDGRIKPDICAPGTNIISCRSHDPKAGTLWGAYNSHYVYCGGTSMATPLVAGAAALVREYYREVCNHSPTAALVKATLINGATDIYPGQYGTGSTQEIPTPRPNNVEGWGMVNVAYLLNPSPSRKVEFVDNTIGLNTNQAAVYTYTVLDNNDPLRVTLVWTDYPASTYAAKTLVNDLDLIVTLPDGSTVRGNGTVDRKNNVEGVDIYSPPLGTYTITVQAYNVPQGPQPFALVVSGNIGLPPPTATIQTPDNNLKVFGLVNVMGTAAGIGFQQYWLEYGVGSNPESWNVLIPPQANPVTNGLLGVWDTTGLPDGIYSLRLRVIGEGGEASDTKIVEIKRTSIFGVKNQPDGANIVLTGKIVTAGPAEFGSVMYIQEPERSSGIRVDLDGLQVEAPIGSIVTVSGTIQTVDGERTIVNPTVSVTGSSASPIPLCMPNRDIGGGELGSYIPGVTDAAGLNNIGLLVGTWGKVTAVLSDSFYIDDGFGVRFGVPGSLGNIGIKVIAGSLPKPSVGQYVFVVGLSSLEVDGDNYRPLLRPRMVSDLRYY